MMRTARSASRAIHIKLVWATCRVPFGLMPVTAKMTVMITARPSHPNQLIPFSPPSARGNDSGRRSFHMSQSRRALPRLLFFCVSYGVPYFITRFFSLLSGFFYRLSIFLPAFSTGPSFVQPDSATIRTININALMTL